MRSFPTLRPVFSIRSMPFGIRLYYHILDTLWSILENLVKIADKLHIRNEQILEKYIKYPSIIKSSGFRTFSQTGHNQVVVCSIIENHDVASKHCECTQR